MTHSHRRENSRHAYFRMDVPKDVRVLAGVASWQHSLGTSEPTLADSRRSAYAAHYKSEVLRLRTINAKVARDDAAKLVGQAFDRLARYFRSMDIVVSSQLQKIALIVCSSWSVDHAIAVETQRREEGMSYRPVHLHPHCPRYRRAPRDHLNAGTS